MQLDPLERQIDFERRVDGVGVAAKLVAHLHNRGFEDFFGVLAEFAPHLRGVALGDGAVLDLEEVDIGAPCVLHDGVHLDFRDAGVNDGVFGLVLFDSGQLAFVLLGLLKLKGLGGFCHLALEGAHDFAQVSAQDVADGRDAGGVGFFRLLAHAGPLQLPMWYSKHTRNLPLPMFSSVRARAQVRMG